MWVHSSFVYGKSATLGVTRGQIAVGHQAIKGACRIGCPDENEPSRHQNNPTTGAHEYSPMLRYSIATL